ncbi:hypothetical protein NIES4102_37080 [Chondrocystis sp. NIES-4102]|nr:hypothetical protein NIES4102_37080 [Chondrocystis sp. NIES-4102]
MCWNYINGFYFKYLVICRYIAAEVKVKTMDIFLTQRGMISRNL